LCSSNSIYPANDAAQRLTFTASTFFEGQKRTNAGLDGKVAGKRRTCRRKSGWQATKEPRIAHNACSRIVRASLTLHMYGCKQRSKQRSKHMHCEPSSVSTVAAAQLKGVVISF